MGINLFLSTRKTTSAVDELKITSERRTPLSPELKPSMKKKLPLILKNRHFVDTTFMCVEAIDKMKMQLKMLVKMKLIRFSN